MGPRCMAGVLWARERRRRSRFLRGEGEPLESSAASGWGPKRDLLRWKGYYDLEIVIHNVMRVGITMIRVSRVWAT